MKESIFRIAQLFLFALTAIGMLQADPDCAARKFKGSYTLLASGNIPVSPIRARGSVGCGWTGRSACANHRQL